MTTQYRGYPTVAALTSPDGRAQINALAVAVDADVAGLVSGMRLAAVLNYTGTGTFQKGNYAGIKMVEVEVIGGGGGSGYAAATTGSQLSWGRGGAGGGYAYGTIEAGSLSSSETVTVGAAGIAGVLALPDGGAGGTSSFGTHLVATGGGGGNDSLVSTAASGTANGPSGGAGSGTAAIITANGEGDDAVTFVTGVVIDVAALKGRRSGGPYGATLGNGIGGSTSGISSQSAIAGGGIGSGARGPLRITSSSGVNGEAGSAGRVIVRVYV
jgi:hypothetical protein